MARPPEYPRFGALLTEVATTTARLLGAERVDLRTWGLLPRSAQHVGGAAYIGDGHLAVGHEVAGFMEGLLGSQGPARAGADLDRVRKVLGTLLHESIHLALPHGHDPRQAEFALTSPSGIFLEEGVTEAGTQVLLRPLLMGQESVFPGISRHIPDRKGHYPNYVPATRALLSMVQRLPEMQGRNALLELARVGPERKFDLLVEQAMDGFGLTLNVPARERVHVRSRIRAGLEAQVRHNRRWMVPADPRNPGRLNTREPQALSTIMGMRMGMELFGRLHQEGERAGMVLPKGWRQSLARDELRLAKGSAGAREFGGRESRGAAASWVATASARLASVSSWPAPPQPAANHSLARPGGRRVARPRYEPSRRGVSR